jgi:hypothetical protein
MEVEGREVSFRSRSNRDRCDEVRQQFVLKEGALDGVEKMAK